MGPVRKQITNRLYKKHIMDKLFFEDLHQQFENSKALMKEKSVVVGAEQNALEAWKKHEAKDMFNIIIDRLDKAIDKCNPENDPNYYRLLAMKASIYYEEAKQLTTLFDCESAGGLLAKALAIIQPYALRIEIVFLILRVMNHYAYILISKDDKIETAQILLQEAENIYNNMCLSGQDTSLFFTTDDLFSSDTEAITKIESSGKLEKLATNNMQMLGYIYHKQGLMDKFVIYHHFVLNRHLELQDHDPLAWATKAERLASYFLRVRRYRDARHHLTAAWTVVNRLERITKSRKPSDQVLATLKKIEFMYNKLATSWVYYGTSLFGYSKVILLHELSEGVEDTIWTTSYPTQAQASSTTGHSHQSSSSTIHGKEDKIDAKTLTENKMEQETMMPFDASSDICLPLKRTSEYSIHDKLSQETLGAYNPPSKETEESFDPRINSVRLTPANLCEAEAALVTNTTDSTADNTLKALLKEDLITKTEHDIGVNILNKHSSSSSSSQIDSTKKSTGTLPKSETKSESNINAGRPNGEETANIPHDNVDSQSHDIPLIFHSLRIAGIERKVPADLIDTTHAARALFNHTYDMLKIAKRYHNVRDHPSDYEHWVLTLCDLYDFLAFYEQDIYAQYELQLHRAESLESLTFVLRRVRPDYYLTVNIELLRELSNIQMELLELNFRKMFCAQMPVMSDISTSLHNMKSFVDAKNRLDSFGEKLKADKLEHQQSSAAAAGDQHENVTV